MAIYVSCKSSEDENQTDQHSNISQNIQKEPWFTKLGPNGRIPVIVDHDQGGFAVQEGLCEYSRPAIENKAD